MSGRLEDEFPSTSWHQAAPPIGPDGVQVHLGHAHAPRTEVGNRPLRALARAAYTAVRSTIRFPRRANYGIEKRVPGRLAGPCR